MVTPPLSLQSSYDVSMPVKWRRASAQDLAPLVEIEKASFPVPWTRNQFKEELAKPTARMWVAESNRVVAFGVYWLVAGEAQLANLAVQPDWRRRGLGRETLERLITEARSEGASKMTLEVRAGNQAALGLYRAMGFIETSRRAKYYAGREDAVLMEKRIEPNSNL